MYEDKIKQKLKEEFSNAEKKEIKKLIDDSMGDFIGSKEFEIQLEKKIKKNLTIKGNKDFEKEVVEISKNVLTQLYKAFWVRRNFWKSSIK